MLGTGTVAHWNVPDRPYLEEETSSGSKHAIMSARKLIDEFNSV